MDVREQRGTDVALRMVLKGLCGLVVGHRDPDDPHEPPGSVFQSVRAWLGVPDIGVGHRLDDDRCPAADCHVPDDICLVFFRET